MDIPLALALDKQKMKKSSLFWIMAILMIATASAELSISSSSSVNFEDKEFNKFMIINYQDTGFLPKPITSISIYLDCQDIGDYNSQAGDFSIKNVTLFANKVALNNTANGYVYHSISTNEGCIFADSCYDGNTPSPLDNYKVYSLLEGEQMQFQLVTYYDTNISNQIILDNPCNFQIATTSENCKGCNSLNYEETINSLDSRKTTFEKISVFYSYMNEFVKMNIQIWIIMSYIIKILVLIGVIYASLHLITWLRMKLNEK